jgi:PAS domain S-box-containing protein
MAEDGNYRREVNEADLSEIGAERYGCFAEETEEDFRATFEEAAIGIAHVAVDGTWLRANRRLCGMLGYQREELLRMTFQDVTHPEDLNVDLELFHAVLDGRRDTYSLEKRYFRKDGSILPVNLTVAVVRQSDRSPSYCISMIEDISARKEMEETLRRSQKMEVIGQLTSSIAHDFGNFLNVIKGNLQILQLSQLDKKNTEYVESALAGTELAEKLIRQLLSFSRHHEAELEPLQVGELVEEISALLRNAVHDRIVLDLDIQPSDFPVICDRVQLETALFNLVLNARDAIGDARGRITISTSIVLKPDGNYVCLSVRDSGQGMSREVLAHAMEPFFTTKAAGEGTGLGLSQVARCVAQMQGFIQIDSRPGDGTEVRLYLPQCRRAMR